MRLIIVDDDDLYRAALVRAAELHPDVDLVAEADGGLAAFSAIVQHRPDVALVDLCMPRSSGIDVCLRLTRLVPALGVRVVVLAAASAADARDAALRAGAAAFLTKDLPRREVLRRTMDVAVGRRSAIDAA